MEVSFSAATQGDQISQVDFSRNLSVYFYALLYLNTEGLRHDSMCNVRGSYLPNQFEEIDLNIVSKKLDVNAGTAWFPPVISAFSTI